MNLRERLRTLRPAARQRADGDLGGGSSPRDSGVSTIGDADPYTLDFGDDVALQSFPTPAGPALGTEQLYPMHHEQGRISLATVLDVPETGWRRLMPMADRPFPVARAVFLDLETTGLGGTGAYAFLIGVGRFVEGRFRLRQFFMRDFGEEYALLEALRAELADAEAVVTFNGRSFDWPLLETRATLHRLRLPRLPHLDVLHPARRVWRPIIGGCSLTELEESVLQLRRTDDVPGSQIPQRYFDFLQTGDAAPLADVLVHNRLDILSMTALAGYVGQAVASPRDGGPDGEPLSGGELFTIGRWLLPDPEGVKCLEESLYRGLPAELRRQCRRLLAAAYRRAERGDEAVAVLESLAADDGLSTWAYVELAKHYEHRARDLATARRWTLRALDLLQRRRLLRAAGGGAEGGRTERERAELLHRLRRIERKMRGVKG